MPDNDQILDLDTLTDEQVMNLKPEEIQAFMTQGVAQDEPEVDPGTVSDATATPAVVDDPGTVVPEPEVPAVVEPKPAVQPAPPVETQPVVPAKPQAPKPAEAPQEPKKPVVETTIDAAGAMDFYTKVSAPFKADGKDIQVRTPEDVVRLMQMGVNYSRRMQEMKPLRAMDTMLKNNGLNDPAKLNFLIDLSKGNPEAIKKLLKDHKVDPIDLDVTKEANYKATNYQTDPKDLAFQEAIDTTLAAEGGKDIIRDINAQWDDESKEALRVEPSIFENLLEQKRSGVYGKIKTELEYQRTMGFLTNVPFLAAYNQVGAAMQKAGVFGSSEVKKEVQPIAPIGAGTRKAVLPKTEQPNPSLSSTSQPRVAPSNDGNQKPIPDYSTMSDADFLKLAPPS